MIETVRVELGARSYDIVIGSDLVARAGDWMLPALPTRRVVIVTDETVADLHLTVLQAALDRAGLRHDCLAIRPGEGSKSIAGLDRLLDGLLALGIDRGVTIVALGGGVVGDLAGFAAAITLRGLGFIQVPTTMLAQVDSSVGGKTGINSPHGKNLIGAFHQPLLVLCDIGLLETLPRRELRAGYAEIVKYGAIDQPGFFDWLEGSGPALIEGDRAVRIRAVKASCMAKAAIVAADERETGRRALLNLGHTFGHALETETGYGDRLLHGEAVALGMVLAFDLSVRLGLCPPEDAERLRRHLRAVGLPTRLGEIEGGWDTAALLRHMAKDKKVRDGRLTFVLTRGIGRAFVSSDVDLDAVAGLLGGALAA